MTTLLLATILPAPLAADLPAHRELRVLIVSDEVNPHGLPDADLTQPGELSAALRQPGAGLRLDPASDGVLEVPTNSIEQATTALEAAPRTPGGYDVLVYFAHRIPNDGSDAQGRQDAFTAAVEAFLIAGGGVVSLHHGAYTAPGKAGVLDLIGATATGAVPWDTVNGQNVIQVAPLHWMGCQGIEYDGTAAYADEARGVAAGTYSWFNNTPDERYPFLEYNPSAIGNVQTLFGSDYNDNGTTHLLGWEHRRPGWRGTVVGWQPGEYEPAALGDLDGNNFQALANAIVYSAGAIPDDHVLLDVQTGAGAGEVLLEWSACDGTFSVYAGSDPAAIGLPETLADSTPGPTWSDVSGADLTFYRIERVTP